MPEIKLIELRAVWAGALGVASVFVAGYIIRLTGGDAPPLFGHYMCDIVALSLWTCGLSWLFFCLTRRKV